MFTRFFNILLSSSNRFNGSFDGWMSHRCLGLRRFIMGLLAWKKSVWSFVICSWHWWSISTGGLYYTTTTWRAKYRGKCSHGGKQSAHDGIEHLTLSTHKPRGIVINRGSSPSGTFKTSGANRRKKAGFQENASEFRKFIILNQKQR